MTEETCRACGQKHEHREPGVEGTLLILALGLLAAFLWRSTW